MIVTMRAAACLLGIASLATGCAKAGPPPEPPRAPAEAAGSSAAPPPSAAPPAAADGRCTAAVVEPLRLAIERSCAIRPEFRDDCLKFYAPLPVWNFDPSRADDPEYCTVSRPDPTTQILSHHSREPACASYSVKFRTDNSGLKLGSADFERCK